MTSLLNDYTKLKHAIEVSETYGDVLKLLGLRAAGGNYKTLKIYIKEFDIDVSKIEQSIKDKRRDGPKSKLEEQFSLENILIENSNYARASLKRRLYKEELKKPICEFCGQGEIWRGSKISLILDHINGVYNDNRLENLRILCPNCNATLDTHCGKNTNIIKKPRKVNTEYKSRPSIRPKKEEIEKLIWDIPSTKIAKLFKVSDKSICKWCTYYSIVKPPRGFWTKYYNNILEGQQCPLL